MTYFCYDSLLRFVFISGHGTLSIYHYCCRIAQPYFGILKITPALWNAYLLTIVNFFLLLLRGCITQWVPPDRFFCQEVCIAQIVPPENNKKFTSYPIICSLLYNIGLKLAARWRNRLGLTSASILDFG